MRTTNRQFSRPACLAVAAVVLAAALAVGSAARAQSPPQVDLRQETSNSATASTTGDVWSWNWTATSATVADCSGLSYGQANERASASQTWVVSWTTGSRRDGDFLCLRALVDDPGNPGRIYVYSSPVRLDLAGPSSDFDSRPAANPGGTGTNAKLWAATVADASNLHTEAAAGAEIVFDGPEATIVSGSRFRYAIVDRSSDCSAGNTGLAASQTGLRLTSTSADALTELRLEVPINDADHGRYICLKLTDGYGNTGHKSSPRIDTRIDNIRLTDDPARQQLRLTAGELLSQIRAVVQAGGSCSRLTADPVATSVSSYAAVYSDSDSLVCLTLTDSAGNVVDYSYSLDRNSPSDPVAGQTGRVILAMATDSDDRPATGDNDHPKAWGIKAWDSYFIDVTAGDAGAALGQACSSDNYGRHSGNDQLPQVWRVADTGSASDRLVLSGSQSRYELVCFRATDYGGNQAWGGLVVGQFDSAGAVINSRRDGYGRFLSLSLSQTSQSIRSWRWERAGDVLSPCHVGLMTGSPSAKGEIALVAADAGGVFCVEALLADNSQVYQLVLAGDNPVDLSPPAITAAWHNNSLQARADDDLSGVLASSWRWQFLDDAAAAADSCRDQADPAIASWRSGSSTGRLGASHKDKYICFQVSDVAGNPAYASFPVQLVDTPVTVVDRTAPQIMIDDNGRFAQAWTTAVDLPPTPVWRYKVSDSSACRESVFSRGAIGYSSTAPIDDGDDVWICFSLADASGNYGFASRRFDRRGPRIQFNQTGGRLVASADETALSWSYYFSDNYPQSCQFSGDNWNWNNQRVYSGSVIDNLTAGDIGNYVCFSARDSQGNFARAVYQIRGPIPADPDQIPVDIYGFGIRFRQTASRLTASADRDIQTWRYLIYRTNPAGYCHHGNQYFQTNDSDYVRTGSRAALAGVDNNNYYCFEAVDRSGNKAYAVYRLQPWGDSQSPYDDVAVDAWYYGYVRTLAAAGVLAGTDCDGDKFCPGQPLKRWQMAVWMIRSLEEEPSTASSRFADVDAGDWWSPYIERMAELGITRGCSADPARYCPDDDVTRGQMAAFLARAFDLPAAEPAGFADVAAGDTHAGDINRLAAAEITVGCRTEPRRYCPGQPVTKAQMAAFLSRAMEIPLADD